MLQKMLIRVTRALQRCKMSDSGNAEGKLNLICGKLSLICVKSRLEFISERGQQRITRLDKALLEYSSSISVFGNLNMKS